MPPPPPRLKLIARDRTTRHMLKSAIQRSFEFYFLKFQTEKRKHLHQLQVFD